MPAEAHYCPGVMISLLRRGQLFTQTVTACYNMLSFLLWLPIAEEEDHSWSGEAQNPSAGLLMPPCANPEQKQQPQPGKWGWRLQKEGRQGKAGKRAGIAGLRFQSKPKNNSGHNVFTVVEASITC